jgi:hypothetical protein
VHALYCIGNAHIIAPCGLAFTILVLYVLCDPPFNVCNVLNHFFDLLATVQSAVELHALVSEVGNGQ